MINTKHPTDRAERLRLRELYEKKKRKPWRGKAADEKEAKDVVENPE